METKIDWKRKLSSRKFWAAVAGFASPLVVTLGGSQETATQITGLIMSGVSLVAYIVAEGIADGLADHGDAEE